MTNLQEISIRVNIPKVNISRNISSPIISYLVRTAHAIPPVLIKLLKYFAPLVPESPGSSVFDSLFSKTSNPSVRER